MTSTKVVVQPPRVSLIAWALVLSMTLPMLAGAQSSEPPLILADAERLALERNPTLAQARADVEAAQGRAKQAGLLPNPTVGYTGEEISSGPIIRGGEHGFFIEQTIPLGGKLRLSREVFNQEVAEAEAREEAQRLNVLTAVRMLYQEAVIAARRVEVRDRLVRLASDATAVSSQLFNVGAADRPDTLEAEIEARRAQLDLVDARNAQYRTWEQLAAVVGDPTLTLRPLSSVVNEAPPELNRDDALSTLLTESPEIKAARVAVARAEAVLTRARREPVPDLVLRGGPRYNRELLEANGQPVGWEATVDVGLVVPLWNRNPGGIAEAAAMLSRARAEQQRLELELRARLALVFEQYLSALRKVDIYRLDVLPRAEQSYNLYLAKYRETAAAYPQVLIAQRTLFQSTDAYLDALDIAWRAAIEIKGLLLASGLSMPTAGDRTMMNTISMGTGR